MPEALLETRGLGKTFGAVVAAEDVSVSVAAGEIVGVIGANGAGKTTFCNMVTGYLTPDQGRILFRGADITGCTVGEATAAGIHRSFQIPQLFPGLTVYENLLLSVGVFGHRRPPWWRPLVRPETQQEARRVMEQYRIADSAETRVDRLPQGVRKLLDIAMAMVGGPAMILLDEPTSGISTEEKFDVMFLNCLKEPVQELRVFVKSGAFVESLSDVPIGSMYDFHIFRAFTTHCRLFRRFNRHYRSKP